MAHDKLAVERAHPNLHRLPASLPAQLRDRKHPTGDAPGPIAEPHRAVGHRGAQPLQRPGQHADAIHQERTVSRIVDVGLDHRRVDAEPPPPDDAPLVGDRHQARQQLLERRPVEDLGEPDQSLRVGDAFALDATEGPVDEVGPDLALALVKASVPKVLQHEHDHGRRGARPAAAPTLRVAVGQSLDHLIEQSVIIKDLIDPPQFGVPQLVAVGEQDLNHAALPKCALNHRPSAWPIQRVLTDGGN